MRGTAGRVEAAGHAWEAAAFDESWSPTNSDASPRVHCLPASIGANQRKAVMPIKFKTSGCLVSIIVSVVLTVGINLLLYSCSR